MKTTDEQNEAGVIVAICIGLALALIGFCALNQEWIAGAK